jgi:hypothetical protein
VFSFTKGISCEVSMFKYWTAADSQQ